MRGLDAVVFLVKDGEILLGHKKRGIGKGYWNGPGGKIEPGETVEQGMIRECQEEIGVTPTTYEKVAHLIFDIGIPDGEPLHIDAYAFIATEWEGEPIETEELVPKWFKLAEIPYKQMWQDDVMWLPLVLWGKKLEAEFTFDEKEQVKTASLTVVDKIE